MKFSKFLLFLGILLATSCTTEPSLKTMEKQHTKHKMSAASKVSVKKGPCADDKAPPSRQCSETVTATFDSKGSLWIAWVVNEQLYVQLSKDQGKSFSEPVVVNNIPEAIASQNESRPKIKLDDQGNIYLTWVLTLDKKRSTFVRFSRSTDGGKHFSMPVTVNDNLEIIRHRFDTLALGKKGEIFIAWLDARHTEAAKKAGTEFKGLSLYYTWSDDGGQHFHPNQKIADHSCECCRLDSAIDKNNLPVISWRHIFEGGIRDHAIVTFNAWESPGSMQHLGQEIWKIDACPHHGPGLSISDNDTYHAVWFSNSDTKQGLFYAHSEDAGKNFSLPVNFGNAGASHPHVLALGERVGVVWQEFDGKQSVVQFMQSKDGGNSWSKPSVIAQTSEILDEPFLVSDGLQLYLSWHAAQEGYHLSFLKD